MTKEQVKQKIIQECIRNGIIKVEKIQYVLATVEHETNRTFKPVREAYWLSERWRMRVLRYYPYYGGDLCKSHMTTTIKSLVTCLG